MRMQLACAEAARICQNPRFMLESEPMSTRFYAFFHFFSRLAAEGEG
jgi:hypothetical protein